MKKNKGLDVLVDYLSFAQRAVTYVHTHTHKHTHIVQDTIEEPKFLIWQGVWEEPMSETRLLMSVSNTAIIFISLSINKATLYGGQTTFWWF